MIKRTRQPWQSPLILVFSTILVAGCSGGSGTGTASQNANSPARSVDAPANGNVHAEGQAGRVGIFLSATPDGKNPAKTGRIWASIVRVELIDIQEKPTTVFESQDGVTIDLNTLYTADGRRFALLASPEVPAGKAYTRARITFAKAFSQFAPDAPTGQMILLADTLAHDDKDNPILSFSLTRPRDLGNGRENLVIDFDLAQMPVRDERLTPSLREGDQNGLQDLSRQIPTSFIGTVQALSGSESPTVKPSPGVTATPAPSTDTPITTTVAKGTAPAAMPSPTPGKTEKATPARPVAAPPTAAVKTPDLPGNRPLFNLALTGNRNMTVQAGEATVYDNDGSSPNPQLSTGKKAIVRGILDPTTKRLLAQRITLLTGDGPSGDTATLHGTVGSLDLKNSLLTLTTTQTEGVLPAFTSVTVQMVPDAVYRSRGGLLLTASDFAAALTGQSGTTVAVSGVYEPVTGTLRGKTARIEDNTPGTAHEAALTGIAQSGDEAAGTLTLSTLTLWQGISVAPESSSIPIATTAATAYTDEKGQFLARASFYRAVKEGQRSVQAVGLYADGKLMATRLELQTASAKAAETKADTQPAAAKPAPETKDEKKSDEKKPDEQTAPPKKEDTTSPVV